MVRLPDEMLRAMRAEAPVVRVKPKREPWVWWRMPRRPGGVVKVKARMA